MRENPNIPEEGEYKRIRKMKKLLYTNTQATAPLLGRGWERFLLILLFAPLLSTAQEVENPVWPMNWPDPTIWQAENGMYYCLATNPRRMLHSSDLFHWAIDDRAPIDSLSCDTIQHIARMYWAPDVTSVGGRRMLYLTLYNSAEDSNIGVFRQEDDGQFHFLRLLTSSRETGIDDTIDPEVVTDPKTGRVWLFFGSVGGIHRVELTADGTQLKEGAVYVHVAGRTIRENPSRSQVYEGSYLHRHGRYWYLFVSAGNYADHTYRLMVGRSKTLTGTFLDRNGKPMAEGNATPVITSDSDDYFFGPGHCGEIFTARDGQEYIFYHCHNAGTRQRGSRPMMMQQILWDKKGWPYVEGGKPARIAHQPLSY